MADEIRITVSLNIQKDNLTYQRQRSFQDDMALAAGPSPADILVPTTGVNVDLSQLDGDAGWCILTNQDLTNWVEWGIKDTLTGVFHPLGELLPGHSAGPLKLSRNFGEQEFGTGTTASSADVLHLRADTASCHVLVEAFAR